MMSPLATVISVSPLPMVLSGARIRLIQRRREDRKSTRLNSSHRTISYAVFCLKKKNRLHDLLPVCEDAIGTVQDRLEALVRVVDRLLSVVVRHVRGDALHRARTEQLARDDDVV